MPQKPATVYSILMDKKQQSLLKMLPGVDHILETARADSFFKDIPKIILVRSIRSFVEDLRKSILDGTENILSESLAASKIIENVKKIISSAITPNLMHTINATGVVIHTNLGRSLLADAAVENLVIISKGYSNLEFDLEQGIRGLRYSCVDDILCELCGSEAAMVVNNNAGAVLLCLNTIANKKKVVVSRGELVEIGGSFRIPDVMTQSGCILKEVGTTNRTHLKDYQKAIEDETGLLLKVHKSNYALVGFQSEVFLQELVQLGKKYHIPVMEDLGSGTFVDFSKYGLLKEPTIQESVAAGADVVTFSGDKLLGGPQAGIIVGKKYLLDKIKQNPLTRALRIDKLTLAALESTLRLYLDMEKAVKVIPTLRMLTDSFAEIEKKAGRLLNMLENIGCAGMTIQLINLSSRAGGGSLPLLELPSKGVEVKIKGMSANAIERFMRKNMPPIIGRIEEDAFVIDNRTINDDEPPVIKTAFENLIKTHQV